MSRILVVIENTDVEGIGTVEELLLARNQLKVVDDGYQELSLVTPEWVTDKMSEISIEITSRVRNELQRRLRAAKARRSALRTADEKRKDLNVEIQELEGKLGA